MGFLGETENICFGYTREFKHNFFYITTFQINLHPCLIFIPKINMKTQKLLSNYFFPK